MERRLLFFNQIPLAGNNSDYSADEKLQYVGLNTGNLVYVDALKRECIYEKELWFSGSGISNAEQYVGILPCANMIGIHDTCTEAWADAIEASNVSVTLAGVGAQSTPELNTPSKLVQALPAKKVNALRRICEQTVSIGIRGAFTAECLDKMHIHNYRIIGCPSLYKDMKSDYRKIKQPTSLKCLINLSPYNMSGGHILQLGMRTHAAWVMQTEGELPKTLLENRKVEARHIAARFPKCILEAEKLQKYIHEYAYIFFEMEDWNQFLKDGDFTFSFGSRFHGNVASLLMGIPSLWITHDSRTQELVDAFSLPYIQAGEIERIRFIDELIEKCDYARFYDKYRLMYTEYINFLEENSIPYKKG